MKYIKNFLLWLLFFFLVVPSYAMSQDTLKQKIASNFEKLIAKSKIQEPSQDISTRSPLGSKLYKTASNGIVLIVTENDVMGSGVVISNKGLVITNCHVVTKEPAVGLLFKQAIRNDGTPISEKDIFIAKVLKTDKVRDLALLQIDTPPPGLSALPFGSLPQIEVGEDVFAISHPKGLLWSYTEGVISQIRPNYKVKADDGTVNCATYIQTQAVMSNGSSGGALFNYNGQLIGIIALSAGPGLNFAIAINDVQDFTLSALETP